MDHIIHVAFFGGQGSRMLFSPSVTSSSRRATLSSNTISLLLSSCHSAFLGELLYLKSLGQLPTWAVFDSVRAPLDLLGVPEQCQKNPIIQGVVLCVHQLVTYLHVEQDWPHKSGSAVAGLCSGILPAAVAASSQDVSTFISLSKEAVRLAFWIGYRVGELSARLGGADWQLHPWSLAVTGLDRAEMEQTLDTFRNNVSHWCL
jgi:malonyl CoA-acyl carrier protein transacylase